MTSSTAGGSGNFDGNILSLMTQVGNKMYQAASNKAKTGRIRSAMSLGNATKSGGTYSIEITVDLKKAPEFLAFEFGSGLHRTRGKPPATYEIRPTEGKGALAFLWPGHPAEHKTGRKYWGPGMEGRLVFGYVDHPGVKAEPAFEPAFREVKREMGDTVKQKVGAALVSSFRIGMK